MLSSVVRQMCQRYLGNQTQKRPADRSIGASPPACQLRNHKQADVSECRGFCGRELAMPFLFGLDCARHATRPCGLDVLQVHLCLSKQSGYMATTSSSVRYNNSCLRFLIFHEIDSSTTKGDLGSSASNTDPTPILVCNLFCTTVLRITRGIYYSARSKICLQLKIQADVPCL